MNKIILNVDTGVDDAMAMILLKRHGITPEFIVAQSGNSSLENTYRNTVGIADILDLDCPVYPGSYTPIVKPEFYEEFHGKNGLACYKFPDAPLKDAENGIIKMYEALKHGKYHVLSTSPLTSLALALRLGSEIRKNITEVTIMGGAFKKTQWGTGNMGDTEFNIFYDPEAARIIFDLDLKETIIPLDLTMKPELALKQILTVKDKGSVGDFVEKATEFMLEKHGSYELHDPIAAYSIIDPGAFKFINGKIDVDSGGVTTIKENVESHQRIAIDIDPGAFRNEILGTIYH